MILNFELDEETGAKLDRACAEEMRTRRNLVTKIVRDWLDMRESDRIQEPQPEEAQ